MPPPRRGGMKNDKSEAFSAGGDLEPQPGKYPIVFPTGSGEVGTRVHAAIDAESVKGNFAEFFDAFTRNPAFEVAINQAGYSDDQVTSSLFKTLLLSMAQKVIASHKSEGLSTGDLAVFLDVKVTNLTPVQTIIDQLGEFSSKLLGTAYRWIDFEATVLALIRAAYDFENLEDSRKSYNKVIDAMWAPVTVDDKRSKLIVACHINQWLDSAASINLSQDDLVSSIYSGKLPKRWDVVKCILGDAATEVEKFFGDGKTKDKIQKLVKSLKSATEVIGLTHKTSPIIMDRDAILMAFECELANTLKWESWLSKHFKTSEVKSSVGSHTQLSTCKISTNVVSVNSTFVQTKVENSFSAAFPIRMMTMGQIPHLASVSASVRLRDKRVKFAQAGFV